MPCNAHNHPPGCNCGWGGIFYETTRFLTQADWTQAKSHTNPNAKCPVCSQPVFFYRSSDGGAVFFDQLGPPWSKHPCTDNSQDAPKQGAETLQRACEGWWPLLRSHTLLYTQPLPNKEGVLICDEEERVIFVKGSIKVLGKDVPVWIKRESGNPGVYKISTISTKKQLTREVVYQAYGPKALDQPEIAEMFRESIKLYTSMGG